LSVNTSEPHFSSIYLQRPFLNPAESPRYNARELGDRTWTSDAGCPNRRSLIEEAQEVRAKGRENLVDLRKSVENRNNLPPSRNILIAHSMGGVASREYVQSDSVYNEDVDKVITLDSPHEGTQALSLLISKHDDWAVNIATSATQFLAVGGLLAAVGDDLFTNYYSLLLWTIGLSYGLSEGLDLAFLRSAFPYDKDDPLAYYIDPDRWEFHFGRLGDRKKGVKNIKDLKAKNVDPNKQIPMFRLLYSTNSLTFTDPENSFAEELFSGVIPDALYVSTRNFYSHIKKDNPTNLKINSAFASMYLGVFFGLGLEESGSSLVPSQSGSAKNTSFLNDANVDVKRVPYNGAFTSGDVPAFASLVETAAIVATTTAAVLSWSPTLALSAKICTITAAALAASGFAAASVIPFIDDFEPSHKAPATSKYQSGWKGTPNTYYKISGGNTTVKPYQMEEFLYEKPFANLRVKSSYDPSWKDTLSDTLGLYIGDSLKPLHISNNLSKYTPLKFKSTSDWETMGVKKERWEITTGVGNEKIPIRHADRYPMPSIMVKDFIRKYEFEIDDLMPQRLRQIRLNFNFNEELAWECDINKNLTDVTACVVFKRSPTSDGWQNIGNEKHPVNEKGIFIFEPENYYKDVGMGAIQKDNQNTVILSMVNKVGLSNSQRFYYLFKATADLVEPVWPLRNIKVSNMNGFTAYISALDYQDISVLGGEERILPRSNDLDYSELPYHPMTTPLRDSEGFLLKSLSDYSNFAGGKYDWEIIAETGDISDPNKSSKSTMIVPFTLDTTLPKIKLIAERKFANPDSIAFLTRFDNEAKIDEALKLVAFFLKQKNKTIATAKFSNVLAPSFGVSLQDFKDSLSNKIETFTDGQYQLVAYAFDGSVGNFQQHNLLNKVVDGDTSVYHLFESNGNIWQGMNVSKESVEFFIDTQPPDIENFSLSRITLDTETSKPNSSFNADSNLFVLNQDSLLQVHISISDSGNQAARYSLLFYDLNNGNSIPIGDTIILKSGKGNKVWKEQRGMLVPDGYYKLSLHVWDEAGNFSKKDYEEILYIDRLPPAIVEVISDKLIFEDTSDVFSAKIYVEQKDSDSLLSEMECHYRINDSAWQKISQTLPKQSERQILSFSMDKNLVGSSHGKRRLEAGCMDLAGNFSSVLDLFYLGELSPIIVYPDSLVTESILAIRGIAPKRFSDDSPASYMLEWRREGDSAWQTAGIDVGAGKRSDSAAWISNGVQPSLGNLGFLYINGFERGNYEIRLSVRDCASCDFRSDVVSFEYWPNDNWSNSLDSLIFAVSGDEDGSFVPGSSTVSISLKVDGDASTDFRARIYAQDSKRNAQFEFSADSLSVSPYEGKPDSLDGDGIWFWSENEIYNLHWNGLPKDERIYIHYANGDIDESACVNNCYAADSLLASNSDSYDVASKQGILIPYESRIPKGLNRVMILSGSSDSIKFKNEKPFWINVRNWEKIVDSSSMVLPIRLGSKSGSATELFVSYVGSFQVNRIFYGLYREWDGISSTGRYPQGDSVIFYAEAIEKKIGGRVLLDSFKVHIKKPDLNIVSASETLDDFYIVNYRGSNGDNGEDMALGQKSVSYGIVGRDALVSAYIKNENGAIVQTLFENKPNSASFSSKAYSVSWNGVNSSEHLVTEGNHYFYITAKESGVLDNPQEASLKLDFKISYSAGVVQVKDDGSTFSTSSLSLLYADSVRSDYWQYTPVADYLVEAEITGKTLPDSLRNLKVEWTASGTQSVYGYPPQRFNLGVKRQRDTLPLVIVTKLKHTIETGVCGIAWVWEKANHHYDSIYTMNTLYFDGRTRKANYNFSYNKNGLDDEWSNNLTIYAFLLKDAGGKTAKYLAENGTYVWKNSIRLPNPGGGDRNKEYSFDRKNTGCIADYNNLDDNSLCIYTPDTITAGYNPNANLFNSARLYSNKEFYTDVVDLSDGCSRSPTRHSRLGFNVELTIPDEEYWNAEYGYDNLVNRTIRIDQTNKTMYGEEGYLKQVFKMPDVSRKQTFFDGDSWSSNYQYGMLTPFETHKIPFVSVGDLGSNNAFAFADETKIYQYPSYFHAKFYNHAEGGKGTFNAYIIGNKNNNGSKDTLKLQSNEDNANKKSSLLTHGSVDIFVALNANLSHFIQDTAQIPYPASENWISERKDTCPSYEENSWLNTTKNEASCKKYYKSGSKAHYYFGDFTDDIWKSYMAKNSYLNNWLNLPEFSTDSFSGYYIANSIYGASELLGKDSVRVDILSINPKNYSNGKFYIPIKHEPFAPEINATYIPKIQNVSKNDISFEFSKKSDSVYIDAHDWDSMSTRRSLEENPQGWNDYPKSDSPIILHTRDFLNDEWIKEPKLKSASLLHLDSSPHTHFEANVENGTDVVLSTRDIASEKRPHELIAVKGLVPSHSDWKLQYLNRSNLQSIASGRSADFILAWLNVSKLQGNTSILLLWGNGGVITNIRKLDLDIGRSVTKSQGGVVQSLFGEVSVAFPSNSIDTVVTVRTADAKDYAFETLNGSVLLGPIVEVLPSMEFTDTTALPRVKSRIAKSELKRMNLSPDRVRLYKIDTENKKFVELQRTLIGFDKEDECKPSDYKICNSYSENWAYLLISAETRTFSAFVALDSAAAEQFNQESAIEPETLLPTYISCTILEDALWLGLDNGYLELTHECNQPTMSTFQLRKDGNVVAEHNQAFPGNIHWDGQTGINKIPHGTYSSRYIAIGATGQEMQIIGPVVYTDTLRPSISGFNVEESSVLIDREYKIHANVQDDYSGISAIRLTWQLGEAISGTANLVADNAGNANYTLVIPRNQLAQCAGCRINISLRAEDMGRNYSEAQWQSERLWPYPADLALWYPAQEGGGKTVREYIGTGHDLNLLMQTPWLSASGIYFEKSGDKAAGNGQVNLGRADSYTLEVWVRPGHVSGLSWHRILGFHAADGRRVDLQIRGSDVRLLDGTQSWMVPALLSQAKTWTHLAIAIDGDYARFYMDGKLADTVAAMPSERIWLGNFSLGTGDDIPSFAGHLMQVRMYKRALEAEEVYALFTGAGLGEGRSLEIVLADELNWKTDGVGRGFSCAVPGSSYWEISKETSLSWRAWAERGASYRVFLYARSAQPGTKAVKAGISGTALLSGTMSLESVWRPIALQEIALPLKSGFNDIELRFPADLDIAGIAISDNPSILPSQISWKSESGTAASSAVYTQVRFEGHPDPSMIRPRIRLQNTGHVPIYGPKVRYYFRGEDPAQVMASKFYPQEGKLIIRQERDNLGYAEWSFPETTVLPAGQLLFWGEGPHFGLHNTSYVPWIVNDDPSFADGSSNVYADAPGIVVLDVENNVLSGSCFENEQPLITTPRAQVFARDSRAGDNQASQLYIKLENIGQVPIKNYEVRYSFYVPGNAVPVLDVYDMQGLNASLKNLGSGRWQVVISGAASLGPGISWANPAQFALHLPNWQSGWQTGDDPSHDGISAEWGIAKGVEIFDASGNRIYGKEPSWIAEIADNSNSSSSSASATGTSVRVMAKETKAYESNASSVRFYVENLGEQSIDGFEVRYWFSPEQGKQPSHQIYNNTQFSASVVNDGDNLYSGRFIYTGAPLAPGAKTEWGDGLEFFIHHSDWSAWNKESDFSHNGLESQFSEANYIAIYNSNGNLIWGTEPVIPENISSNPPIEIAILPDGLLISLLENSNLMLDLVNAAGMPQKFLFQGTLSAGQHLIAANWSNVDFARTYLVVRLNGQISSQLISKFNKLGN